MKERLIILCLIMVMLGSCCYSPPKDSDNICNIFKQYPQWYWQSKAVATRWGVPIELQMAILYQESKFIGTAKPKRNKLFGIIPWRRPSSAYGYTQALSGTWQHYVREQPGLWISRSDFSSAVDFVGWYTNMAYKKANIPLNDAYNQYLAYHEGIGGYQRNSYKQKPWLLAIAKKVQIKMRIYQAQLKECGTKLPTKPWYQW